MPGFRIGTFNLNYDASQPSMYNFPISVGNVSETVEVSGQALQIQTESGTNTFHGNGASIGGAITAQDVVVSMPMVNTPVNGRNAVQMAPGQAWLAQQASANVMNLQKRVSGVLPVPVDVPRAGTSFAFVRPLVLDEETKVTFSYKSR
jgi:hypothetical protein